MCGILAYIGAKEAPSVLISGLKKLEYRGYDSSGIAVLDRGKVKLRRAVGKLSELEKILKKNHINGQIGLGHTRWATHGAPSELNAHPHTDSERKIVVVHNGIIENYRLLKERLQSQGFAFKSETDTEVVAHLVASHYKPPPNASVEVKKKVFTDAVLSALREIEGTFALGIINSTIDNFIIGARRDCPLIVGLGEGENFLASDAPAILSYTRKVVFLEENDLAILDGNAVRIFQPSGRPVERKSTTILWDPIQAEKAGYKHFMLKEIHEQPRVVEDTLLGRLNLETGKVTLEDSGLSEEDAKDIKRIRFVACGTSWHAALVGSFLIEKHGGVPCQVDIASEFRYRDPMIEPGTLLVAVSQSGETADTLAAVRLAKKKGAKVVAIANVVGSSLTREADGTIMTHCGPEIGVASTKAFMGQLVALSLLNLYLCSAKKTCSEKVLKSLSSSLAHLPRWLTETLKVQSSIAKAAKAFHKRHDFLFLGRHLNYPIALEGALKLKEISYIHAEGYPAGEMKHGPIALIDENLPIVVIATKSKVYEKILSNMEEARSRGAQIIAIATQGDTMVNGKASHVLYVPDVPEELTPMVAVVPLQLLAYQIAVLRGCDVDQPRNLAKSVTVE